MFSSEREGFTKVGAPRIQESGRRGKGVNIDVHYLSCGLWVRISSFML